jgi:hypothetical protein
MSDLKPGDSVAVSYLGTRVEVEQAVSMGLLVRNPAGGYRTPSQAEVTFLTIHQPGARALGPTKMARQRSPRMGRPSTVCGGLALPAIDGHDLDDIPFAETLARHRAA